MTERPITPRRDSDPPAASEDTSPAPLEGAGSGPVLTVWACGQQSEARLLRGTGYVPATRRDADRVLVGVARSAITAYSRPGQTVADPDCGSGTVLVEAVRAGRHAVGMCTERRWRPVARGNITAAKRAGACADAVLLAGWRRGPGTALARTARAAGLAGRVDLAATTLRYPDPDHHRDPVDPAALLDRATVRLARALTRCAPWLSPTGRVVVIAKPVRGEDGMLLDTFGALLAAARTAQLVPVARHVAVTAALHGTTVATRAGRRGRRAAAWTRSAGHLVTVPAHQDVLVLRPSRHILGASAVSLTTRQPRSTNAVVDAPLSAPSVGGCSA